MLIETPKGGYYLGKEGGIANAIVGSLLPFPRGLRLLLLMSLPAAFALQKEYANRGLASFTRLVLDILWGIPSIVYGAFGFVVMVYFGLTGIPPGRHHRPHPPHAPHHGALHGRGNQNDPRELKEISYALGTTKLETTLSVVLKQALPGIVTAVLLAFGRGIGDAASILFTAGYTDYIPRSLFDPVASLPLAVFFQIGTPIPEVQERAYASALPASHHLALCASCHVS